MSVQPTPATEEAARRELAALTPPTKLDLKLWQITVTYVKDRGHADRRTFFLDADIQGLDEASDAVEYAEEIVAGDLYASITAFPVHYTITKD